ncbi:Histidine biosynthesis bifunctional hisB [Gossypium arboreum]|uniref:Histidine biosynthesis bifunctional hisB n=1 Tax=Gossypium arboreum TaxID=29729 RepID=A0A0B0NX85_GOSAR|nr:Histidine biosynthesis bifunctional hisB [Gossypium arboreum]
MLLNQQDSSSEEIEFSYSRVEGSSLMVMACTRCLMYVMACEINLKCANCKTSYHLLDLFRDLPQSPLRNQGIFSLF